MTASRSSSTRCARRSGAAAAPCRTCTPAALLAEVFRALCDRTGLPPDQIDDVVAGCATQVGEQAGNIAQDGGVDGGIPGHGSRHHGDPGLRVIATGRAFCGQHDPRGRLRHRHDGWRRADVAIPRAATTTRSSAGVIRANSSSASRCRPWARRPSGSPSAGSWNGPGSTSLRCAATNSRPRPTTAADSTRRCCR